MHLKGTKSMAMSGCGCERPLVAAELAIFSCFKTQNGPLTLYSLQF